MESSTVRSASGPSRISTHLPDVAWFQKKLTPARLRVAARLKASGCVVVYDCDESGTELDYWTSPALATEMLALADVVITDTPERGRLLRELTSSCRPQVLENQADFSDRIPAESPPPRNSDVLRVLWFGHGSNLDSLSAYREVFRSAKDIRWVFCGPRRSDVRRALGPISAEVRTWSRQEFAAVLTSCDLTLLSHFGSRDQAAKSAHKMVTSICHGVPALVSATPDYSRVAARAGVPDDAVYSSPDQLRALLERMKSADMRSAYLARSRAVLLERYGPGTFAAAAALLLRDLIATPAAPRYAAR